MQIRLTVVDPLGPHASAASAVPATDRPARCDVLVTAPAGTALAAVASALAATLPGEGPGSGQVVLYAGAQRLDAQRSTLGEPPLIDGAVLCLGAPGEPDPHTEPAEVPAQLHVVAGPDAGGVHLLHGGQIRLGRSADADVALDDPDVSRMHCAVTVGPDARVSVADLGSTNGTTLDGTRVGDRPVRFPPGALLRIGESALRLVPVPPTAQERVATTPDGEGHVRLTGPGAPSSEDGDGGAVVHARAADGAEGQVRDADGRSRATGPGRHGPADGPARQAGPSGFSRVADPDGRADGRGSVAADGAAPDPAPRGTGPDGTVRPRGRTHHAYGTSGYDRGAAPAEPPQVPGQGGAPRIESRGTGSSAGLPRQSPPGARRTAARGARGRTRPAGPARADPALRPRGQPAGAHPAGTRTPRDLRPRGRPVPARAIRTPTGPARAHTALPPRAHRGATRTAGTRTTGTRTRGTRAAGTPPTARASPGRTGRARSRPTRAPSAGTRPAPGTPARARPVRRLTAPPTPPAVRTAPARTPAPDVAAPRAPAPHARGLPCGAPTCRRRCAGAGG